MSISKILRGEESKKDITTDIHCHSLDTYELKSDNFTLLDGVVETPIYRGLVETIDSIYGWNPLSAFDVYYDVKGDTIGSKALYMKQGRSFKVQYGLNTQYSGQIQGGVHYLYFNFDDDVQTEEIQFSMAGPAIVICTLEFFVYSVAESKANVYYTVIAYNPTDGYSYSRNGALVLPLTDSVTHVKNIYYKSVTAQSIPTSQTRIRYMVERVA